MAGLTFPVLTQTLQAQRADAFSSVSGNNEALALPALKRVIRVGTLSQSAKALLPPHKWGAATGRFKSNLSQCHTCHK
jgi:hypothetical protein